MLMGKPSYSAFYADMYVAMAFHFVNCHHVCFVVTNESRVACFSLALFPASPINDPEGNNAHNSFVVDNKFAVQINDG